MLCLIIIQIIQHKLNFLKTTIVLKLISLAVLNFQKGKQIIYLIKK